MYYVKTILATTLVAAISAGLAAGEVNVAIHSRVERTAPYEGGMGFAATKTSGTTVSFTCSEAAAQGKVLVAFCNTKPIGLTGATSAHGVSDTGGNNWTRLVEYTDQNKLTCSIWISTVSNALSTSDSITLTTSSAVLNKTIRVCRFSGFSYSLAGSASGSGTGDQGAVTISGLANQQYIWLGLTGWVTSRATTDESWEQLGHLYTVGNPPSSNIGASCGFEVETATTNSYLTGWDTDTIEWVGVAVALDN